MALQERFLSALPGEALEPAGEGETFSVYRLRDKIDPSPEDPIVRQIVEEGILNSQFQQLVVCHIQWVIPPE